MASISSNKQVECIEKLMNLAVENGEIVKAEFHKGKKYNRFLSAKFRGAEEFYALHIKLHAEQGSNIGVTLGLPANNWNGKLLGIGNGGAAGDTGVSSLFRGLSFGYASVHTDLGSTKNPYHCAGSKIVLRDFGHRATHLMTVVAKEIIRSFYGRYPEHSYFFGGSTGGQQGLAEAQRYPEDYDGIVCFCPAYDRTRLHVQFLWNMLSVNRDGKSMFTKKQIKSVTARLVEEYGRQCGAAPGDQFLPYPDQIEKMDFRIFSDKKMTEPLSMEQIKCLERIYGGPIDPVTGERIFFGLTPGSESEGLGLNDMANEENFTKTLLFPFYWTYGRTKDLHGFDFHLDYRKALEDMSENLDATDTDLSAFRANGGRIIMIHGTADAAIPYSSSLSYYNKVAVKDGGLDATKKYFRYFLVPGLAHGFGGPGFQDIGNLGYANLPADALHDPLIALDKWVSEGEAPEVLIETAFQNGDILRAKPIKERPVYAYPLRTKYVGGTPDAVESYGGEAECVSAKEESHAEDS